MKKTQSHELKVSIIGCGNVGVTAAYAMMLDGTPTEIVLVSRDLKKARGEKLDLEHALPFLDYVKITATDDYKDIAGSHLVVYTAGVAQRPGDTRLDLCDRNIAILRTILPEIMKNAPDAVLLMIANPVDILTYYANKQYPQAKGRIFGSGTMLDTARFRFHLSEKLGVDPQSVHAYILGEHGDSSFPVFAHATVGGKKLTSFDGMTDAVIKDAYTQARQAAYNIIQAKGATYYAIGIVARRIMQVIQSDAKTVLPLSVPLDGLYGEKGVSLSVPCVLGSRGVENVLEIELSAQEQAGLKKSADQLRSYCKTL